MRKVGSLESAQKAETFRWYLVSQDIETQMDDVGEANSDIWIFHDKDWKKARALLDQFKNSIDLSTFEDAAEKVQRTFQSANEKKVKAVETRVVQTGSHSNATFALIALSVLFFMLHFLDRDKWLMRHLMISEDIFGSALGFRNFRELLSGQVWRLVTPIFIHTDFFHIAFNMLWLYQFGRSIEEAMGSVRLTLLVVLIAAVSNFAYYVVAGPMFGGMSGVVYGLFFFMWAHEHFSVNSPFQMDPYLVKFFVIYYVICWILSAIGFHIANTVHGMGAFTGFLAAYFMSGAMKRRKPFANWNSTKIYNVLIILCLLVGGMITDLVTR